jgi:hypothetical protein
LVEKEQIMATNTNKKNTNNQKTESYVCINIDKMRKTVGYAATMKAVYRTLPIDCVYIAFPSGREMKIHAPSPDKFDELVDKVEEECKDSTDEDWEV